MSLRKPVLRSVVVRKAALGKAQWHHRKNDGTLPHSGVLSCDGALHRSNPRGRGGAEEGSALVSVLVIITLVTILTGTILLFSSLEHHFVRRDLTRLKMRYAAEAAVYDALSKMGKDLRTVRHETEIVEGFPFTVYVAPFGGFARATVIATGQDKPMVLRALVGRSAPLDFENAIVLGDTRSPLTLTGEAQVRGPIATGNRGVETRALRGIPFRGKVDGRVYRRSRPSFPAYDTSPYDRTIEEAERLLSIAAGDISDTDVDRTSGSANQRASPGSQATTSTAANTASQVTAPAIFLSRGGELGKRYGDYDVLMSPGSLTLTPTRLEAALSGKSSKVPSGTVSSEDPVIVVVAGDLFVEDPLVLKPGSMLIAGRTVRVSGKATGQEVLAYGRKGVFVGGRARFDGQFISEDQVRVGGQASLEYPSVAYVASPKGELYVAGDATLDGLILFPESDPSLAETGHQVTVGKSARVRGAVYSAARVNIAGTIHGSALAWQFGFYESPAYYVNWMRDATVERDLRPTAFAVPYGFTGSGAPTVIQWSDVTRKAAGAGIVNGVDAL